MQERHDRSGSERGQHVKQGSMEEEANQLYRRPQVTGQAREEEEDVSTGCQIKSNQVYLYTAYFHKIQGCLQYKTMYVNIKIKLTNSHNYYKYLHH